MAMAVHGSALAYMTRSRLDVAPQRPTEEKPLEVTIEALPSEPAPLPREPASRDDTSAPPSAGVLPRTAIDPGALRPLPATSGDAASPVPPSSASPSPSASGSPEDPDARASRARGAVASLFGGGPPMVGAMPEASSAPLAEQVPKDKAGRLLRDSLGEHDRAVGLGIGGPVVSAARSAALSANAPSEGVATYQVITDATGAVTEVRVLDANGPGWDRVASSILGSLRGQKLRVSPGARGMTVTVRLEARFQLPSGAKSYKKGFTGLGAGTEFDLSDIGAKQIRTVMARVLGEGAL